MYSLMYLMYRLITMGVPITDVQSNIRLYHTDHIRSNVSDVQSSETDVQSNHLKQCLAHSDCACAQLLSHAQLFGTPWTVACQGIPRQEYWSGLPFSPLGDLPNPRTELESPALAGRFFTTEPKVHW